MNIETIREQLDTYYANNQAELGYAFLLEQLALAMQQNEDTIVLGLLSEILGYMRVTGQYEQGKKIASKASTMIVALGLEETIAGGTTYLNIATFYSIAKEYGLAKTYYQKAQTIYEQLLPDIDERLASLYNNSSIFYQQTNLFTEAYSCQNKAISILTKLPNCESELATSYTNLAEICYSLGRYEEGITYVQNSILKYQELELQDAHYAAALATLANGYYHIQEFTQAIAYYNQAQEVLVTMYGKIDSYHTIEENKKLVQQEYEKYQKSGMYLCTSYFEEVGKPLLKANFPTLYERMAIGLVGMGSECFGFDDEISKDHDFGPGFCIWLTDADYQEYGKQVAAVYQSLPRQYRGYTRNTSLRGQDRVGVFSITSFYQQYLSALPKSNVDWLQIPEIVLATITNGKVFQDPIQQFTAVRIQLQSYYPTAVRMKKIIACIAIMAQAGQYNYARCMQRKSYVAANQAIAQFVEATMKCIYLLNYRYMPYYKWSHTGILKLPILSSLHKDLETLVSLPLQCDAWNKDSSYYRDHLNEADPVVTIIESICEKIRLELQKQNLTDMTDAFLEAHTSAMMEKIDDPKIQTIAIMEGY